MSWLFTPPKKERHAAPEPLYQEQIPQATQFQDTDYPSSANSFPASTSGVFDDLSHLDPSRLHPLAGLSDTLEYLVLEDEALNNLPGSESALPSRGWSDDLCYGTGTTYLACLGTGGAYGIYEGLSRAKPGDSFKLRLNTVLNNVTRRGPFLGNSGAVVALIYNGINSAIGAVRGQHDTYNSVGSGVLAGALFRSTRGIRSMGIAGSLCGLAALGWSLGKQRAISGGSTAEQMLEEHRV